MAELVLTPYRWYLGDPNRNEKILDEFVAHPEWCTIPLEADELRVVAAAALTAHDSMAWECWREGELVGILLLTRVMPKVDALFHFLFFDHNLVGKRLLLKQFFQRCFDELGLHRISMEASEHQIKYIGFCRKLGFRYEGETTMTTVSDSRGTDRTAKRLAQYGSRREQAYCHKGKWLDIELLRLLPKDLAHANKSTDNRSGSHTGAKDHRGDRERRKKENRASGTT